MYNYFTDGTYDASICNFNISKRIVIDNYCKMREQNRAFTIFLKWLGFNSTVIDIEHNKRAEGKSSYNIHKKIKMAVSFVTSQSNKPLYFAIYIGTFFAIFSFLMIIAGIWNYFSAGTIPTGWTSVFVSIYLVGGLLLVFLGIIGIYIGNIFEESKKRPLYVIRETINHSEKGKEE
jgi:dolichol-phosphate mannosyltransferase